MYTYSYDSCYYCSDYDSSIISSTNSPFYQTFVLDCDGATGDMIYITDVELQENAKYGHSISEVKVYGTGTFDKVIRGKGWEQDMVIRPKI